jgi:hypothetical protein
MRTARLALVSTVAALLAGGGVGAGAAAAYPWPFKPFNEQHPIRGFFGDPRTVYYNGILAGAFGGPGVFSFHQGIDIAAPNGTPIYAVANGTAHYLGAATLNLDTGTGVAFQFFHIVPVVGEGERVTVSKTVLGYVQPPYQHVHISEIDGTHVVNPLQVGHLAPYRDRTKPTIRGVIIKNSTGALQPLGLCGRVEIDADAYDTPPVPVPGSFGGLPATPAIVSWTLTRLGGGRVVPWTTVADFRHTLPPNSQFWSVFAQGTYQNAPRFGREQYSSTPGRYLFVLAAAFDTASVSNGVYLVTVRAGDVRGNHALLSQRIEILNGPDPSACPGSLPAPPGAPPPDEPSSP